MKRLLLFLLLLVPAALGAQSYLQTANNCFTRGDYECAKKYYAAYEDETGANVNAQLNKADECHKLLVTADIMYNDQNYDIAQAKYEALLRLNPNDPHAKQRLADCRRRTAATTKRNGEIWAPDGIELVYVQGGTFVMGCTDEQGSDCRDDEKPAHKVTLSGYYIGKYEVTQALWEAVMGSNPSHFKGGNRPVENVSYDDVQEFIRRLNAKTGGNYRLPTEAEWEFAARGGTQSNGYKYSGSNNPDNVAWYSDIYGRTHSVGGKYGNELGIYDMSGNVYEWCHDWHGTYSSSSQTNPKGPSSGSLRVLRGGSWYCNAQGSRSAFRYGNTPASRDYGIGFRLASGTNQ